MYETIKTEIKTIWITLQYELLKLNINDQRLEDNVLGRCKLSNKLCSLQIGDLN